MANNFGEKWSLMSVILSFLGEKEKKKHITSSSGRGKVGRIPLSALPDS